MKVDSLLVHWFLISRRNCDGRSVRFISATHSGRCHGARISCVQVISTLSLSNGLACRIMLTILKMRSRLCSKSLLARLISPPTPARATATKMMISAARVLLPDFLPAENTSSVIPHVAGRRALEGMPQKYFLLGIEHKRPISFRIDEIVLNERNRVAFQSRDRCAVLIGLQCPPRPQRKRI
jgi:hypothetical protein